MKTKSFDKSCVDGNPIIICGARLYGELAYLGLEKIGASRYCTFFCDRFMSGNKLRGINIITLAKLKKIYKGKKVHILIAATKAFDEICSSIVEEGFENYYNISYLLDQINYDNLNLESTRTYENNLSEKYKAYLGIENHNKLILPFLSLSVTSKCTLNCKNCCALMQYYLHQRDDDLSLIINSFNKFMDCVDKIYELQIIGGEPFAHSEIDKILKYCSSFKQIDEITIVTNSTIIPNKETINALKNPKVKVVLDDYGEISKKIRELIEIFNRNDIKYDIMKQKAWNDMGDITNRNYNKEELSSVFNSCYFRKCKVFISGKAGCCDFSIRSIDLGLVPDNDDDYVDFTDPSESSEKLIIKLKKLYYKKRYLNACKYCSGTKNSVKGIPVAEQIPRKKEQL